MAIVTTRWDVLSVLVGLVEDVGGSWLIAVGVRKGLPERAEDRIYPRAATRSGIFPEPLSLGGHATHSKVSDESFVNGCSTSSIQPRSQPSAPVLVLHETCEWVT